VAVDLGQQRLEDTVGVEPQRLGRLRPYEVARGSWAYSCRVNVMPARVSATVAGVPPADVFAT